MAIISKKSDYHYSDLSRWGSETVGSDIYPLRPTEQKRVLKFCDKAFVTEAYLSRTYAGLGITLNGGTVFVTYPRVPPDSWGTAPLSRQLVSSGNFKPYAQGMWGAKAPDIAKERFFGTENDLLSASFPGFKEISTSFWQELRGPLYVYYLDYWFQTIADYKACKYAYAVAALPPNLTYEDNDGSPTGAPIRYGFARSNLIYDYSDGRDPSHEESPYESEGQTVQTSPICTLDVQEPAKSGASLELYLLCYIDGHAQKASGRNDSLEVVGNFLFPLSSFDGRTVSSQLIAFGKSLLPAETYSETYETSFYTRTYTCSSCSFGITFKSIVAVLRSNVDIDWEGE